MLRQEEDLGYCVYHSGIMENNIHFKLVVEADEC